MRICTHYKIIRFYAPHKRQRRREMTEAVLTLKQARAHCNDPKTRKAGEWFDGYERATCNCRHD